MKIAVFLPTKSTKDPLISLGQDYIKKCRYPMNIEALFVDPKDDLLIKSHSYYKIALCEEGTHYTSQEWARHLSLLMQKQAKMAFLIGEASGLSKGVIDRSEETLSLSKFTLPHRMAFLVLCEQLYRTCEILRNSPYHK